MKKLLFALLLTIFIVPSICSLNTNGERSLASEAHVQLGKRMQTEDGANDIPRKVAKPMKKLGLDKLRAATDPLCIDGLDSPLLTSCQCEVLAAIRGISSDGEVIRIVQDMEPSCLTSKEGFQTVLHVAVAKGREEFLRFLLGRMPVSISIRDFYGKTALDVAVDSRASGIAEILIEHGARVMDDMIHRAVVTPQNCEMIDVLLKGSGWLQRKETKKTSPIFDAIEKDGNLENVKCLIHRLSMDVRNERGQSPLIAAATKPVFDLEVFRLVEAFAELDPSLESLDEVEDQERLANIFMAARQVGNDNILRALLPLVDVATAFQGASEVHLAASLPSSDWLEELLRNDADTMVRDDQMRTPLHVAAGMNNAHNVELLLQHGADINARDIDGNSILHYAFTVGAEHLNSSLIELAVLSGTDLNAQRIDGATVLTALALEIERMSESLSDSGMSELETSAVRRGIQLYLEQLAYLMHHGADPTIPDANGESALTLLPAEVMYLRTQAEVGSGRTTIVAPAA